MKINLKCLKDDLDTIKAKTDLDVSGIFGRIYWDEEIALYIDTNKKIVELDEGKTVHQFFSNIHQFLKFYAGLTIIKDSNEADRGTV